eukprot:g9908.t1
MDLGECKGDTKDQEDAEAARHAVTLPALKVLSVECGPSDCPVDERLELSMDFALDQPLRGAWWEVKFLVDSVNRRHLVRLGATAERDFPTGSCSMNFQVSRVPVEGIKSCTLANTGLLVATLMWRGEQGESKGDGGEEKGGEEKEGEVVAQVNLVVQVTNADVAKGKLTRVIYSPLE